jgi:hypothetical protein
MCSGSTRYSSSYASYAAPDARGRTLHDLLGDLHPPVVLHPRPRRYQAAVITFFLQAAQVVDLAADAASVTTGVVSWNEAAEMKESLDSDFLAIPRSSGPPADGFLPPSRSARSRR